MLNELLNKLNEEDFDFEDIEIEDDPVDEENAKLVGYKAFLEMIDQPNNRLFIKRAMHKAESKLTTGMALAIVDYIADGVEAQIQYHIYELERELGIELEREEE